MQFSGKKGDRTPEKKYLNSVEKTKGGKDSSHQHYVGSKER